VDDSPLLFELVRASPQDYAANRCRVLQNAGVAKTSHIYQLGLQIAPASPLGDTLLAGIHLLTDLSFAADLPEPSGLELLGSASYAAIAHCGTRLDPSATEPPTTMIVLTHPTDLGHDDAFNTWYTDEHMPDVALSPGFLGGATRYRPTSQHFAAPLGYLCVYEVEAPCSDALHADLIQWQMHTEVPSRVPMPKTPAGEDVLTIDLWGYFSRIR